MGKAHQQQKWVFWVLVIFNKIAEEPQKPKKHHRFVPNLKNHI